MLLIASLSDFDLKRHLKYREGFQCIDVNLTFFLVICLTSEELQFKLPALSITKNFVKCFTWIECRVSSIEGYYINQFSQSNDINRLYGIIFQGVSLGQILWSNRRIVMISSAQALWWYIKDVKWFPQSCTRVFI